MSAILKDCTLRKLSLERTKMSGYRYRPVPLREYPPLRDMLKDSLFHSTTGEASMFKQVSAMFLGALLGSLLGCTLGAAVIYVIMKTVLVVSSP